MAPGSGPNDDPAQIPTHRRREKGTNVIEQMYRQCKLRRGTTFQIVWIPLRLAKVGKMVRVNDDWHGDWLVVEAWSTAPEHLLTFNERSHRAEFASLK